MATALINGQESIISQIHTSWNEFRSTDEAMVLMFGEVGSNYRDYHEIPLAKDFAKSDTPWTTKETVLEKNAVHANNLIRYYIGLNIDVAERMPIWQFFEIGMGIVGKIKEQIKLLKRIQKVLKLEQELDVHEPIPSATSLFTHTGNISLDEIEDDFKVKVKEAKKLAAKEAKAQQKSIAEAKRRNAALRRAKKEQKRKDTLKKKKAALRRTEDWIEANKQGKNVAKREMLKMLEIMERDGNTIKDAIEELKRQIQ